MIDVRDRLVAEIGRVVVGQERAVDDLLTALLVGGHVLLEGVPGVAKTLLANATARALGLEFRRVQFTPDMLPSDLTGTMTLRGGELVFRPGPVFTEVLLADEINRTPPKTQAALLEAMQEGQVTIEGSPRPLGDVFLVIATQNPIEYEGTYPLPEAQLDRFLFNTILDYLSASDELKVVDLTTTTKVAKVEPVTTAQELLDFQQLVRMVPIGEPVAKYVVNLVRATRYKNENAPDFVKKYVNYGGSIRAAQYIVLAAKARALSRRRYHVTYDDVTSLAIPVLRHRILLNFHAESERVDADEILRRLIEHMPPPKEA